MNDLERLIKEQVANVPLEQEFKAGGRYVGTGKRDTTDYEAIRQARRKEQEQAEAKVGIGGARTLRGAGGAVEQLTRAVDEEGLGESIGVLGRERGEVVPLGKRWWDQF